MSFVNFVNHPKPLEVVLQRPPRPPPGTPLPELNLVPFWNITQRRSYAPMVWNGYSELQNYVAQCAQKKLAPSRSSRWACVSPLCTFTSPLHSPYVQHTLGSKFPARIWSLIACEEVKFLLDERTWRKTYVGAWYSCWFDERRGAEQCDYEGQHFWWKQIHFLKIFWSRCFGWWFYATDIRLTDWRSNGRALSKYTMSSNEGKDQMEQSMNAYQKTNWPARMPGSYEL